MPTLTIGKPNLKQELFFKSAKRFTGYGGARGGGKSWALRTKLVLLALNYANLKLLLLRKTYQELEENHITPLKVMLKDIAKYNDSKKVFTFPNGSRIKLGYCAREDDVYQFQGQEYDVIGVEECTHFTFTQIQFLKTCNRNIRTDFKPRMYFTGNPGGVGHAWFKRLYVKGQYEENENPNDYLFIPATVDDNTILMKNNPEYVEILDSLPEKLKQAHRFGNWDIFEGQFFEEFIDRNEPYKDDNGNIIANEPYKERRYTHVIEPFEIPPQWQIYRSFDWGYSRPFSCGWWAVDYSGVVYRIFELYGCTKTANEGVKWHPDKVFGEIQRIESEHRWLKGKQIHGVADPAIWNASTGKSIVEFADDHFVYFEKGDNQRIPGWMQMHYRLAFDDNGFPMMYIFNTCKAFIRTFPTLQYDDNKVEDLDTDGEDHIADEARYFCMSRPIKPQSNSTDKQLEFDPLDMNKEKYKSYGSPYDF